MRTINIKFFIVMTIAFLLNACASLLVKHDYNSSESIRENQYTRYASTKGVVLLAASWSRVWGCGGFENAELRSIGFDRLVEPQGKDNPPEFVINGTADISGFINYAFLLDPGTYAISHVNVKVAKSIVNVGYLKASRRELFDSDVPKGGTFEIRPGEVVYIGHFGLDCANQPMLWRFYLEDKKDFEAYVSSYKTHYPYLALDAVQYRLFKTQMFGTDFSLN
ncbi:MAG: hypothetical protein KC594_07895 [Nitrospira sp.]|nr:hypothetical protein [Nitrospira sp.]